jgi:hypothetical protein
MRCLCLVNAALLASLVGGCGGSQEEVGEQTAWLAVASAKQVEGEIPGCEALSERSPGQRFRLLRHPADSALVLVARDACPVCIDTLAGALQGLRRVGVNTRSHSAPALLIAGSSEPMADAAPSPEEESGTGAGGSDDESQGDNLHMQTPRGQLISDDPIPPGHSPEMRGAGLAQQGSK